MTSGRSSTGWSHGVKGGSPPEPLLPLSYPSLPLFFSTLCSQRPQLRLSLPVKGLTASRWKVGSRPRLSLSTDQTTHPTLNHFRTKGREAEATLVMGYQTLRRPANLEGSANRKGVRER